MNHVRDFLVRESGFDPETIDVFLLDFEAFDMNKCGRQVGTMILRKGGHEVHIAGEKDLLTRKNIREVFVPVLAHIGYATTFTGINEADKRRFIERVGFVLTHTDDRFAYYRLEKLRHA